MLRLLAAIALAVAVIMAVGDATRSIAAKNLVLVPLDQVWQATAPDGLQAFRTFVGTQLGPAVLQVAEAVMTLPGCLVFSALALMLYAAGRKPRRRVGRLAAGA